MFGNRGKHNVAFEEALSDDWSSDLDVAEAPLNPRSFYYLGLLVLAIGAVAAGRIFLLNTLDGDFYVGRARANSASLEKVAAPRGLILDTHGKVLADNKPVFLALLQVGEFVKQVSFQDETLRAAQIILGLTKEEVLSRIEENNLSALGEAVVLSDDLTQDQLVRLKSLNLPTISITSGFQRRYPDGKVFASVIGYTGLVDKQDLRLHPELTGKDWVGKTGLELAYEDRLQGEAGSFFRVRDAQGNILEEKSGESSKIGESLELTLDADFQSYFYKRMEKGLLDLGRKVGVGLAIDPRTGAVLAMVNAPSFDNNAFSTRGMSKERETILTSPLKPLFNRAISGFYAPGSTIKPLVATAALEEGVIEPNRYIFSPGFLDVPNPYNPEAPTRFLDWRRQGNVNLASAIAQSSNVYFYLLGGGSPGTPEGAGIKGLGIRRLREWWEKFNLGSLMGIDLPHEAAGSLPSPEMKEKKTGQPWLLGDTYNVSIGQGELLVTPLQLVSYIGAIANGGKIYQPFLARDRGNSKVIRDISYAISSIREVQKGMVQAVTAPLGTARFMSSLPLKVAAKTGTAQTKDKAEENAFFVGYAPADDPQIAVLVLVENALEGSLNAVPIAKDVLEWYYKNRIMKLES